MIPYLHGSDRWVTPILWTLGTVAVSWLAGHLLNAILLPRVARWTTRTEGTWDEVIVAVIKPRIPWWTFLIGVWLSLSYWPLTAEARVIGDRTMFVLAVATVTLSTASIGSRLVGDYGARFAPALSVTTLSKNIVWAAVVAFGALAVLNRLGVSITPLITAFGVGGLAVALALQDPLANFFAGLVITLASHVRVGDYIKLDTGVEGEVVDFNWRLTRIRIANGKLVLVPNAKLSQAIVTNYSLPTSELPVSLDIGVDAASDLEQVEHVVTAVGRQVMADVGGLNASPIVRFHTFGNAFVKFTVWLVVKDARTQLLLVHEFTKRLHAQFRRDGIVIRA